MKTGRPARSIKPRRLPPWRDDHDSVLAHLRWIRTEFHGGRLSASAATVHSAIASKATTALAARHQLNELADLRELVQRQEAATAGRRAGEIADRHDGTGQVGEMLVPVTDEE